MLCSLCKKRPATTNFKTCSFCRERIRIMQNIKTDKAQRRAIEYKGGNCLDCGSSYIVKDVYDFHHRDENQKLYDLHLIWPRAWNIVQTELDKCDMLCANCHQVRHYPEASLEKVACVEIKGNECHICKKSYDSPTVYQFHHLRDKKYEINRLLRSNRTYGKILKIELEKCIMVCANCHRIIHYEKRDQKDLYTPRFNLADHFIRKFHKKKLPAYLSYEPPEETLKQKILVAKRAGKEYREMAEEWGIEYKKIIKTVECLQKEMSLQQRIPYELLTQKEINLSLGIIK